MVLTLVVLRVTVGGLATVMLVLVDEEKPVTVSVTAMVRVSDPSFVFVSVNVAKAALIAASVPESVMDLPSALALAPVALNVPFVSEMVTDRALLPGDSSVIVSPVRIVGLLISMVLTLVSLGLIVGNLATAMVMLLADDRPVPVSMMEMFRASYPSAELVSFNVAKAALIVVSEPESVMDLPAALALAPVALNLPFVSEMMTTRVLLPADASVIVSPVRIVGLLISMALTLVVLVVSAGALATVMNSLPEELNPVPVSVAVMLRLSAPTVGFVSLSVAKAAFTTPKVPERVIWFGFS